MVHQQMRGHIANKQVGIRKKSNMSLIKAIQHKKEKRKEYRGAKAVSKSCRNHGGCSYCEEGRLHNSEKRKEKTKYDTIQYNKGQDT